jgi:hypothetical protein
METFNLNKDTLTFDTITDPQADAVYGRLKMLQDLRDHIEVLQESYTRLLVVNEKDSDEQFNHTLLEHEHPPQSQSRSPPSSADTAGDGTRSASA